jgi:hypothetical protein
MGMNSIKAAILLAAVLGGATIAPSADARRGHHHHHHHRSGVGIWFGVPAPFYYYPRYYYPPAYYPPAVIAAPAAPPVYIEQSAPPAYAAPSQSSGAYWYFCRDSQTYYPYVQQCASPWQQVVPNSAPPS